MKPDLLEHAVELFPTPEPAFERLLRRRDRKRRERRIVAGIVAIIVAVAAIANLALTFRSNHGPRPVDRGIDVTDVGGLTLAWTAIAPRIGVGWVGGASVGEGILLVATNEGLAAYEAHCGAGGERCSPLWTTPSTHGIMVDDSPQNWGAAIIADGVAYVPGEEHLSAFPLRCRTDGGRCDPSWTSSLTGDFTDTRTTLVSGELVGSYYDRDARTSAVYAMPAGCGGSVCDPDWTAPGWTFPIVSGDRVFALSHDGVHDGVAAFPLECRTDGGTCSPLWTASGHPGDLATDGSNLYVSTPRGLVAYPVSCSGPGCEPRWFAWDVGVSLVMGDGMVFGTTSHGDLVAYSNHCADDGARCRPAWVVPGARPLTVRDGLVIATVHHLIAAFRVGCRYDGGICRPQWRSAASPGVDVGGPSAAVHGGVVFAPLVDRARWGSARGLVAYELRCRSDGGTCRPVWTSSFEHPTLWFIGPIIDADRLYLVAEAGRRGRSVSTRILAYGPKSAATPSGGSGAVAAPADDRPAASSAWPSLAVMAVATLLAAYTILWRRRKAPPDVAMR